MAGTPKNTSAACGGPQRVPAALVQPLRRAILRPDQPRAASIYAADEDPRTCHMAIVMDGEVVAVGSLFAEDGWRIRGMATAPAHRRRGLASRVLLGLIAEAWGRDRCRVWCNARTSVAGFYEGHAFVAVGPEFELEGIGPHVRMVRSPDVPPPGSSEAT